MTVPPTERPFDLVIFDCDGVLVDSERLSIALDAVFLEQLGWPMSEADIVERFVGRTEAAMKAEIETHLGRDISAEWDAFADRYLAAFASELEPVDGIEVVLAAVHATGHAMCVASSGDREKIVRNLSKTRLDGWFDDRIFSADDVVHGKPAPDLFLHAARVMGVDPVRCAVVEDSRHGVAAARAAGMWAFAYAGGVTPASALAGERTAVFTDMRQLPGLLGASGG